MERVGQLYEPLALDNEDSQQVHPLQHWAVHVEQAVHQTLVQQHEQDPVQFPISGLPKAYRGRCQPRKLVKTPSTHRIKHACDGQYQPKVDQASMNLTHTTRQLRRIQSLRNRLKKDTSHTKHNDLDREWQSILNAPGFHGGFSRWMNQHPELHPVPLYLPAWEYLHDVAQLLEHHNDQRAYFESKRAKQLAQFRLDQDLKKYGKQMAFRSIREPAPGLLHMVQQPVSFRATVQGDYHYGLLTVTSHAIPPMDLRKPVRVHDQEAQIVSVDDTTLEVMLPDPDIVLPAEVMVTQDRTTSQPIEVANKLTEFWTQFWNRDSVEEQTNLELWPAFLDLQATIRYIPQLEQDFQDLAVWKAILSTTKSQTSRGICAWAADELKDLPDNALTDLQTIFLSHLREGFPEFLMKAKTLPLEKSVDTTDVSRTRPITITSLLYRFWGRTISHHVLQEWSRWMPPAINGFLPHRCPANWHYDMQLQLEAVNSGVQSQHLGGVTLDIVKCYNGLPHAPIASLLGALGVPLEIIDTWIASVSHLDRYWLVDGQHFPAGKPSTGLAEGDPVAVAAMVAVNYLWVKQLEGHPITPSAYADNWAYFTPAPAEHRVALGVMLRTTKALRLRIDWHKTWGWGTSKPHKQTLKSAKQNLAQPDLKISVVTHARELGYVVHYRLRPFRGPQKIRHKAALTRLRRLQKSTLPIPTKASIAKSACVTKALWGTHLYGCGQKFFDDLRTGISRALLGQHKNIQGFLTTMVLTLMIEDPELYTIVQAVKHARAFLIAATDNQRRLYLQIASKPNKRISNAIGPASALTVYLAKVAWSVDRDGNLHTTELTALHLWESNQEDILLALEKAWMAHVSVTLSTRKGFRHVPLIDRKGSHTAFASIPVEHQLTLAIQCTNGNMSSKQKSKFLHDHDDKCQLCGLTDSFHHQILECEALATARHPYEALCAQLVELNPVHLALPLKFADPRQEWIDALQHSLPEADIAPVDFALDRLYTDAACKHPKSYQGRWVTYSIVALRPLQSNQQALAATHHQQRAVVLGTAHLHGRQTVPRGELLATIQAHQASPEATVVTDSSYAVHCHSLVKATPYVHTLHARRNFDLLQRLHRLYWEQRHHLPVAKIKSHQQLPPVAHPDFEDILGNQVADATAVAAHASMSSDLLAQFQDVRHHHEEASELLKGQFALRQALAELRIRLIQPEVQYGDPSAHKDQLYAHAVQEGWSYEAPQDEADAVLASRYGYQYSHALMQWLATLRWPSQPEDAPLPTGITWIEMAVNFQLVTQRGLPLNVGTNRAPRFACPGDLQALDRGAYTFDMEVNAFRHSVEHLEFLTGTAVIPQVSRQRVRSLQLLYGGPIRHGLPLRPQLNFQRETLDAVAHYGTQVLDGSSFTAHLRPEIPILMSSCTEFPNPPVDDTPQARGSRYHQRRVALRNRRRAGGGED
eukprot:Skav202498  [mRNA]  locus=scaffold32:141161:145471:+ [translate_table: standard]